eukprot:COSAG02_NODE_32611_length_513_cov_1.125604_1_plen_148_part_10
MQETTMTDFIHVDRLSHLASRVACRRTLMLKDELHSVRSTRCWLGQLPRIAIGQSPGRSHVTLPWQLSTQRLCTCDTDVKASLRQPFHKYGRYHHGRTARGLCSRSCHHYRRSRFGRPRSSHSAAMLSHQHQIESERRSEARFLRLHR